MSLDIVSLFFIIGLLLSVAAMSGYISERAGIVNIAIEGFMSMGAMIYTILRGSFGAGGWNQIPAALITMIVTSLFTIFHSFICIKLKANQVISGTAINLLSLGIIAFLINVVYKDSPDFANGTLPSQFDYIGVDKNDVLSPWRWVNLLNIAAVIIIILLFIMMRYTRLGLRLIASGENPNALAAQGISVNRTRYIAIFISGALAGLAGSMYGQWQPSFRGSVDGLGFIALAILICGQWRIPFIVLAALIFGTLVTVASNSGRFEGFIKNNYFLVQTFPFFLSILVLIVTSKFSRVPKMAGVPYDKKMR